MSNRGSICTTTTFHVALTQKTDGIDYISGNFWNPTCTLRKAIVRLPSSATFSLDYDLRKWSHFKTWLHIPRQEFSCWPNSENWSNLLDLCKPLKSYLHPSLGHGDNSLFRDVFPGIRPSEGDHMSNRDSMYYIYHDSTFHVDLTQTTDRID